MSVVAYPIIDVIVINGTILAKPRVQENYNRVDLGSIKHVDQLKYK